MITVFINIIIERINRLLCAVIVLSILGSCSSEDKPGGNTSIAVKPDFNVEFTQQDREACEGINRFSHKLMAEMLTNDALVDLEGKNFAISPFGCAVEMAMLANSTDSLSANKLCDILQVSDLNTLGAVCNKLMSYLAAPENGGEFKIANAVWYAERNAPSIPESYIKSMNSTYFADVNGADLATSAGEKLINSWVTSKTNGLIRDLDGMFEPSAATDALILNALYVNIKENVSFYADWTKLDIFHAPEGDRQVRMMLERYYQGFFEDDTKIVVAMGYETKLFFIIPKEGHSLAEVCPDTEEWNMISNIMEKYWVELRVPQLSVASTFKLSSLPMLAQATNLSLTGLGLSTGKEGTVGQTTRLTLKESGLEMSSASRAPQLEVPEKVVNITIDRPFLFYVTNANTGTVIMSGRILDASNQNYK